MKVYKIRRKSDGLFSTGGTHPSFSNRGKLWKRIGDLKNHLHLVKENRDYWDRYGKHKAPHPYENCEIVEYTVIESENSILEIDERYV